MTDIEIANSIKKSDISEILRSAGIEEKYAVKYGNYKAKIDLKFLKDVETKKDGKLILVTAISPTAAGEGKTTTTIGLADALNKLGVKANVALREPSLGPVFGVKGGATGGGYAQVVPMEDINLHFTGDFHAIGAANNLLCAMLDNHIFQGNALNIDKNCIFIKRAVDMNDRQLRFITDGEGGVKNGVPRADGFDITVASEVMAAFCLSGSIKDLKERLGKIIVAKTTDGKLVTAKDLKAAGAMTALLKDAFNPNLVQTLEKTPAFIHGGPFANIAHGCNSLVATRVALKCADYTVTEAGFGADLGAEKFLDIKCRIGGLSPSAVVLVATVRALKMHGGVDKNDLKTENLAAVEAGVKNLLRHALNIKDVFKLPLSVAINRFPTDTNDEINLIKKSCEDIGVTAVLSDVWGKGGSGGLDLAKIVLNLADNAQSRFEYAYSENDGVKEKIEKIVKKIYRGAGVKYTEAAERDIKFVNENGFDNLLVCMAKTQYGFSDDKTLLGAPSGFTVTVKSVTVSAGAGFLVVKTGDILTMPGLPKIPAAENIDVDDDGNITGIF